MILSPLLVLLNIPTSTITQHQCPTEPNSDGCRIRLLQEDDLSALTKIFVIEWGPSNKRSCTFSLFPPLLKYNHLCNYIDNFVLATIVYLGLAQRWNRRGLMEDPDDHRVLVVERSNEVIGSAELSWQSKGHTALPLALPKRFKQFMNQQRLVPYVSNVVIREDSRSRGHGSELLKAIEELVSLREEEHIYLHVNHQDTSAVNFYARLGYRPVQESDDMASKTGWLRRLVLLAVGLYFVDQPRSDYLSKHLKRSS